MENQKKKLLLVCCRPKDLLKDAPLPQHQEWFTEAMGIDPEQIDTIYAADETYPSLESYSGVIIGGSKHSVYDDIPWIPALEDFVRHIFDIRKPYLGVCFGHQIAVKALGGAVVKGEQGPEVGPTAVELTRAGKDDVLFSGVEDCFSIAQFHGDIVSRLPDRNDLKILVKNETYTHQAFAYGDFARTVQFHPEFTPEIISYIIHTHKDDLLKDKLFASEDDAIQVMNALAENTFQKNGRKIAKNFYNHFVHAQG